MKHPKTIERDERIRLAYKLLRQGWSKGAVKDAIRKQFGDISVHSLESYITAAKNRILEEAGVSETEMRADAYAFYQFLKTDKSSNNKIKLRAQEMICELYGLNKAPATGGIGSDTQPLSPSALRQLMAATLNQAETNDSAAPRDPDPLPPDSAATTEPGPGDPNSHR